MSSFFEQLYVLDLANNHQGSLDHGLAVIEGMGRVVRERGVRAALKFQFRDLDTLVHPAYRERKDVKHIPRFLETALDAAAYATMTAAVRDAGMLSMATPFDEPSVDRVVELEIDIVKVASCSATDWPLLERIAEVNKPTLVSTGGLTIHEIDRIVSFFTHKGIDLALMHCVSIYPTPDHSANLAFLGKMIRRYSGIPVGYSGHESPGNTAIAQVAVAVGAQMLERHVGIVTDAITLNAYSMTPEEVGIWIDAAQRARVILGREGDKKVEQAEVDSLLSLQRGVFVKDAVKTGEPLTRDKVFFAMPCQPGQLTSGAFGQYRVEYVASRDYAAGEGVFEPEKSDATSRLHGIIHDAKGMLHEARIVLGKDDEIELSHHYGVERFRQIGALIVNVINREYCKKYVIVLPGQRHPNHRHRIKEETFFVLWGDLTITLNGDTRTLQPGDKLLIERGSWHSFHTEKGCIVEEVSTTHQVGDSEYEDNAISALDISQRKTIIAFW